MAIKPINYELTNAERRNIHPDRAKGYYTLSFTTKISKASKKDVDLSQDYGLYLVGKFHKIYPILIYLEEKTVNTTISSVDTIYYVKFGDLYLGKLSISLQQYPKYTNILFVYKSKNTSINFKKKMLGEKYTHGKALTSDYADYKKRYNTGKLTQSKYHED